MAVCYSITMTSIGSFHRPAQGGSNYLTGSSPKVQPISPFYRLPKNKSLMLFSLYADLARRHSSIPSFLMMATIAILPRPLFRASAW